MVQNRQRLVHQAPTQDEGRSPIKVARLVRAVSAHDGYDGPGILMFSDV